MLRLHRLQLGVILAHFPHKIFLQVQYFVELDQFLGELSLSQCMMGSHLWGVLGSIAGDILFNALGGKHLNIHLFQRQTKKLNGQTLLFKQ